MQFPVSDSVTVAADFNTPSATAKTVIVLNHMARASRGEYLKIAERLNALGYATLAVDQRCGGQFNGVKNETVAAAGDSKDFVDAIPDLVAANGGCTKGWRARLLIFGWVSARVGRQIPWLCGCDHVIFTR